MTIEFVLDEKGNPQKDAATGLYLVKRDGNAEPLDIDRLFAGIATSNNDAADKRRKLDAANSELATMKGSLDAAKAELEALKANGGGGTPKDPKESETERRIKALEESNAKKDEENKRLKQEQEQRENDRQIEAAFSESAFVAEHGHIPADMIYARYRSHLAFEEVNGARTLVVKDANGNVYMSEKIPGLPAKLDEGLAALCASRPKPGDIKLNPAPYGGTGSQQPQRYGMASNPWNKGKENVTMQHKIMAEDPALAQRLQAQAGIQPAM